MKLLIIFIILFTSSEQERVSDTKCREFSNQIHRSSQKFSHLVSIGSLFGTAYHHTCDGTLISEKHVISSSTYKLDNPKNYVYFTNGNFTKLGREFLYRAKDLIEIKRIFSHDSGINIFELDNIQSSENFRPACLWTADIPNNRNIFSIGWHIDKEDRFFGTTNEDLFISKVEYKISDNCTGFNMIDIGKNYKCCSKISKNLFKPSQMIQIENDGKSYVYGHIINETADGNLLIASNLLSDIDWIESVVWPDIFDTRSSLQQLQCGERKVRHKSYIYYSSPTYPGEFPWHVGINEISSSRDTKKYICGGTLVSSKMVITAAHCVVTSIGITLPELLTVDIGRYRRSETDSHSREVEVLDIFVHDQFNLEYLENDIALLKLSKVLVFSNHIQPICISNDLTIFDSRLGFVPGWGRDENNLLSDALGQALVPIQPNAYCRQSNREFFSLFLNENSFCGGLENGTNVCMGDSGGGLVFEASGKFFLRGIVSVGVRLASESTLNEKCDTTQLVVYTNATMFYDWITSHINK